MIRFTKFEGFLLVFFIIVMAIVEVPVKAWKKLTNTFKNID